MDQSLTKADAVRVILQVSWAVGEEFPEEGKLLRAFSKSKQDLTHGRFVQEARSYLTTVERKPGLSAEVFGIVALAKVALVNEEKLEQFRRKIARHQGLE